MEYVCKSELHIQRHIQICMYVCSIVKVSHSVFLPETIYFLLWSKIGWTHKFQIYHWQLSFFCNLRLLNYKVVYISVPQMYCFGKYQFNISSCIHNTSYIKYNQLICCTVSSLQSNSWNESLIRKVDSFDL